MQNRITLVILAGGKSSRMGRDKGLIEWEGKPFFKHILDRCHGVGTDNLLISSNKAYSDRNVEVVPDIIPDRGPLGGIYTAFELRRNNDLLVLSCDNPTVNSHLLKGLISSIQDEDAAVLKTDNGRINPFPCLLRNSAFTIVKEQIENNRLSMFQLFDQMRVVKVDPYHFDKEYREINLNTKSDLLEL